MSGENNPVPLEKILWKVDSGKELGLLKTENKENQNHSVREIEDGQEN